MTGPAAAPREVARRLAQTLAALPAPLVGVYLHGSAVLGGWTASRSDVDVIVVVADGSGAAAEAALRAALLQAATECPGAGLECSVVTRGAAATPVEPWPFVLHVASTGGGARCMEGSSIPGDPDLLMHYLVAREHGWAEAGPPAAEVFGAPPRATVLRYLHGELAWGLEHGTEPYAVLTALRAVAYARDGLVLSKVDAGRRALEAPGAPWPADLVRRCLLAQQGGAEPALPSPEAASLVAAAQDAVADASYRPVPT